MLRKAAEIQRVQSLAGPDTLLYPDTRGRTGIFLYEKEAGPLAQITQMSSLSVKCMYLQKRQLTSRPPTCTFTEDDADLAHGTFRSQSHRERSRYVGDKCCRIAVLEPKGGYRELGTSERTMEPDQGSCQKTMGQAHRRRPNHHCRPTGSARGQNTGKVRYCERGSRQAGEDLGVHEGQ